MKPFLKNERPIITCFLTPGKKEDMEKEINAAINQGAEGFCFQMELLPPESKNEETIKGLFNKMGDRLIYVTNYKRGSVYPDLTDEQRAEELLNAIGWGANLIDIPTDMFADSECEFSMEKDAVEKQKKLAEKAHQMGAKVLISSHIFKYMPKEAVLSIALSQQERGADIAKVVVWADTEEELCEAFETNALLKKRLDIDFLFLINGKMSRKHRLMGPLMSGGIYLTTLNEKNETQPKICEAQSLIDLCERGKENE